MDYVITLDANGIPDMATVHAHGSSQDTIQWKATVKSDGTYPQWYIFLLDPFSDHVIVTNANTGKSSKIKVCQSYPQPGAYCPYWATANDPRLLIKKKAHLTTGPAGGIIIDN